jgi:NAD(P)-dependent dehydrogenase (short-subunit alcohol dehydrogenase family)
MQIDDDNGNTRWRDSEVLELSQIDEYDTFIDKGKGYDPGPGYKRIKVHFVYAVKLYAQNLTGQTALVTGANSGTGFECALALARLGASVTLACRNPVRCQKAADTIRADSMFQDRGGGTVSTMTLDTSSLASVQSFGKAYRSNPQTQSKLDMLFLNAGIGSGGGGKTVPLSEDGIELVFATNHVGHHLLFHLLEPLLFQSKMARIVLTSSAGSFHSFDYKVATNLETLNNVEISSPRDMQKVYGQSKLMQVFFCPGIDAAFGGKETGPRLRQCCPSWSREYGYL